MKSSGGGRRAHVKRILFFVTLDMFSIDYGYIGSLGCSPSSEESCGGRKERKESEREEKGGRTRRKSRQPVIKIGRRRLTIVVRRSRAFNAKLHLRVAFERTKPAVGSRPARTTLTQLRDRVYKSLATRVEALRVEVHVHFRAALTHRETQPRAPALSHVDARSRDDARVNVTLTVNVSPTRVTCM